MNLRRTCPVLLTLLLGCASAAAAWLGLSWGAGSDGAVPAEADRAVNRAPQTTPDGVELDAACREAADWISRRLGGRCRVIVRVPMVVAGDLPEEELDRWYRQTIRPAARAMAADYFTTRPDEPITILLFGDRQSYHTHAKRLFGEEPISTDGFYRPHLRIVITNAGAGSVPLMHELTHALAAFDFPDAPDWLNEGLASLHEQFRIRDDGLGIEGIAGRRLAILRAAIRQDRLRSIESLIGADDFHVRGEKLNYAHARYFCLYMQSHGVLRECYGRLRGNVNDDPCGHATVAGLFPKLTWRELDADFRRWVLGLGI